MIARVTYGCPVPTWLWSIVEKEPEHKWAELHCPEPPVKSSNLALLSNSSLWAWRQKETKGRKRKVEGCQKRNLNCISRNMFCINRKEKRIPVLENTGVLYWSHSALHLQAEAELWAGRKSFSLIISFQFQHHLISPYPWSFPAWHFIIPSLDLHTENCPSHFGTIMEWRFTWKNNFYETILAPLSALCNLLSLGAASGSLANP